MTSSSKQSQNENPRTIFLLYEPGHVAELERFCRERPEEKKNSLVVALSLDIEMKLMQKDIAFSSGRKYKQPFLDLLATEDEMIESFFADKRWVAFEYRGVDLKTTFCFMFRAYLQRVFYYGNFLISIVENNSSVKNLVLFTSSGTVSSVSGGLVAREITVVVDCAKVIAAIRSITVVVIPISQPLTSLQDSARLLFFNLRRMLFGFVLKIWNMAIVIVRRSKHPRLLVSDYWKNIGPVIDLLKEAECIFIDRMEIWNINWRGLLRFRMRFVHSENFLPRDMRIRADVHAQKLAQTWSEMRVGMDSIFVCRGYSLDSLLLNAIDDIVHGFGRLLHEIDGTYALYEHIKPDIVVLRASVSGQTHFSVLPLVAKNCSIPSLELQHGLEYLGVGSLSREHAAEYIAVYGPLIRKELISIGYVPRKVYNIGSPRFDKYHATVPRDSKESTFRPFTVLCIAPDIRPFEIYDSYSAEDYLSAVAQSVKDLADVHVVIKLRSESTCEGLLLQAIITNAFSHISYRIATSESLSELFSLADVVVSCYSTAILEALQCGMPVIIPALNPVDKIVVDFHFSSYCDARVLFIVYAQSEFSEILAELLTNSALRREMCARTRTFLADNFCFDENSSCRFAELIAKLSTL